MRVAHVLVQIWWHVWCQTESRHTGGSVNPRTWSILKAASILLVQDAGDRLLCIVNHCGCMTTAPNVCTFCLPDICTWSNLPGLPPPYFHTASE